MGVVIEREEWALSPFAYPLLSAAALAAVLLLPSPRGLRRTPRDPLPPSTWAPHPSSGFAAPSSSSSPSRPWLKGSIPCSGRISSCGVGLAGSRWPRALPLPLQLRCFPGAISGIITDKTGPRRACILYWALQLAVGAMKSFNVLRCSWINNFILAFASSVFSFCFETWLVLEHEKQDQKQDLLFDTVWLMTFFESVSLIGSQEITNVLVSDDDTRFLFPYSFAATLSVVGILYIRNASSTSQSTSQHASAIGSYQKSFFAHVLRDKRVLILVLAQASIHFAVSTFWFLWAPTIVADGRYAQLSVIYPCFLASRMLGSAGFPWFYGAAAPFWNEESLTVAYIAAGLALSIVAYNYQEIGILVIVFCILHACVGFILPSLSRLRTMAPTMDASQIQQS